MLKPIDNEVFGEVKSRFDSDPFGIIIGSLYEACRNEYDFCTCLYQQSDSGEIAALLSVYMGSMTLAAESVADFDELRLYCNASAPHKILSDEGSIINLGYNPSATGSIMRLNEAHIKAPTRDDCEVKAVPADYKSLRELYNLIFPGELRDKEHFDYWYTYNSHMMRHNVSRAAAVFYDESDLPVACAMTQGENENAALISSVKVQSEYRRQGLGSLAVSALSNQLVSVGKTVWLFSRNEDTDSFYSKNGFIMCGNWAKAVIQ
jgi:GNAT superfamily N-acetyltransferase